MNMCMLFHKYKYVDHDSLFVAPLNNKHSPCLGQLPNYRPHCQWRQFHNLCRRFDFVHCQLIESENKYSIIRVCMHTYIYYCISVGLKA